MSNQELEVKFVLDTPVSNAWNSDLEGAFLAAGFAIEKKPTLRLTNIYFDTQNNHFETYKMGMRVRGCDGKFEQTLKTQKTVNAGVHQRNEYNIPLDTDTPDLALFPDEAWPEELLGEVSTFELKPQFSTHFVRQVILLSNAMGTCELVLDEGEVKTENSTKPINEIEIELVEGPISVLLNAAKVLEPFGVRLSDVSKAAQGYALLNGQPNKVKKLPSSLALSEDETTEDAFCRSCEQALKHWQTHEHLYSETDSDKMLIEIATGVRLLLQSLTLFLPVIQCQPLLVLQRDLLLFSEKWLWVDDLQCTRFLLSRKGPFFKTLSRQTAITSYLQGRHVGLLNSYQPKALFSSEDANHIKMSVLTLLIEKPWRSQISVSNMPVIDHAKGWLSQGWQILHQAIQPARTLQAANYIAVEPLMRQTLFNGFILSGLFANSGPARAPWLDLLEGIDEIRALQFLKQALVEAELEYEEGLEAWVEEKLDHLLSIMERTRQVAVSKNMYW
ncbi:CYTH domain-containing protein [Alteromonas sp. 5E99-2]|uniref:CYTH domain-containing protein n=1 Tax=Alteromonas sp. 5E99-2 TaxID=2817683 RepID=UPI001A991397|nr:CYTH domain-containing protein [Alteromonas sp. 5E99-2]MBO1256626.1 CYTH domain-containing protein [Alteromonas sp. 5E99-2]